MPPSTPTLYGLCQWKRGPAVEVRGFFLIHRGKPQTSVFEVCAPGYRVSVMVKDSTNRRNNMKQGCEGMPGSYSSGSAPDGGPRSPRVGAQSSVLSNSALPRFHDTVMRLLNSSKVITRFAQSGESFFLSLSVESHKGQGRVAQIVQVGFVNCIRWRFRLKS